MSDAGRGTFSPAGKSAEEMVGFRRLSPPLWQEADPCAPPAAMRGTLARTIETEIIPRLMLAHRAHQPGAGLTTEAPRRSADVQPRGAAAPTEADIERLCEVIVRQPLEAVRRHVDALLIGMTRAALIVDVLSPAARHLGLLWEQDRVSFVDVTIGLSRLQQVLRVYGPAYDGDEMPADASPRILLAATPGEQHTFGLSVVEEYFRRAGWDVVCEAAPTTALLAERLGGEWFDALGLSASGEVTARDVAGIIRRLRRASLNRDLRVVLGGCLFNDDPDLALTMGADFGARDAGDALLRVGSLIEPRKMSC